MMSKRKNVDGLFDGRHFDREIIILCVRWYLRYKLSLRDLVEMMSEGGISDPCRAALATGYRVRRRVRQQHARAGTVSHAKSQTFHRDATYYPACVVPP
jgi:transposase-like protein